MENRWKKCLLSALLVITAIGWTAGSAAGAGSVIAVDRTAPAEVQVGDMFEYQIKVTNVSDVSLEDVAVSESVSGSFKFDSAQPTPASVSGQQMSWQLGNIGPGANKTIRVKGSATQEGLLENCGSVRVSYGLDKCNATKVVRPELKLVKTGPAEVLLCDPIPVEMVITNTGSGAAQNVVISDTFPEGMSTQDGNRAITAKVGTLEPGQSRRVSVTLKASGAGKYDNRAVATADRGLTAEATHSVIVREPKLALAKTGPKMRYLSRNATYTITVSNRGDGVARDTKVVDMLPDGMTLLSASEGGRQAGKQVTWNVGALEPGASRNVSVKLQADRIGMMTNRVMAQAYCAEASAEFTTEVAGIPAILLEVIDVDDPIEVGTNETYIITVTNQGSAIGTGIEIVCTLPAELEYVSGRGPTNPTVDGKRVAFAPLAQLAPQDTATYRLIVKGTGTGDVRFRVELTSDQMTSPAMETESTHLYE